MTLHLLFNHALTTNQEADAIGTLGVDEFVSLPGELQQLWSNVPSDSEGLNSYLSPIETYMKETVKSGDYVLVQGDFGATYRMVNLAKSLGATPIYATTSRDAVEVVEGDTVVKKSVFRHRRFRRYG